VRGLDVKCCAGVLWKVLCAAVFVLRKVLRAELVPPRPAHWKYNLVPPRPLHKTIVREKSCAHVVGLSVVQGEYYASLVRVIFEFSFFYLFNAVFWNLIFGAGADIAGNIDFTKEGYRIQKCKASHHVLQSLLVDAPEILLAFFSILKPDSDIT